MLLVAACCRFRMSICHLPEQFAANYFSGTAQSHYHYQFPGNLKGFLPPAVTTWCHSAASRMSYPCNHLKMMERQHTYWNKNPKDISAQIYDSQVYSLWWTYQYVQQLKLLLNNYKCQWKSQKDLHHQTKLKSQLESSAKSQRMSENHTKYVRLWIYQLFPFGS